MTEIADPLAYVQALSAKEKSELDRLLLPELTAKWLPDPRNEPQLQAYYSDADLMLYGGAAGGGKALHIATPIPTPRGWTTMGALAVGDVVFDECGSPVNIIGASPVMIGRPCFLVQFSDGAEVIADAEHRWLTTTIVERRALLRRSDEWRARRRSARPRRGTGKKEWLSESNSKRKFQYVSPTSGSIRSTLEIVETLYVRGRVNHAVLISGALHREPKKLPIDPYLFGAWLGDGASRNSRLTIAENEMVELVTAAAAQNGWETRPGATRYDYGIVGGLRVALRNLNVLGGKAIPDIYLQSSIEQRIALLQGLMDTDGHADNRGQCEFTSVSEGLAQQVLELIRSLGCKANICTGDATLNGQVIGPKYRIKFLATFPVFRLSRKVARQKCAGHRKTVSQRYIENVRSIPSVPVRCIEVDSKSRLFLCGRELIPTHNSDLVCGLALNCHTNSVIFRKQATDLRGIEERLIGLAGRDGWNSTFKFMRLGSKLIELGHLDKPGSEESWRGRPHDFIGFDEGAQLSDYKVRFVLGWLRSADPKQRRRAIIASNPPTGGEGKWLISWFAPWLDPGFRNPALQGELRWAATAPDREGTTVWLPDGAPIVFTGGREWRYASEAELAQGDANPDVVEPQTRTFIQSLLRNNPYLANTGYRRQIQSLPEPLRSQLLNGDFVVGREDHEWQVIPTSWVREAQERWQRQPPNGALMTAIGVDVAQGGGDRTVLAPRHGPWYAPLIERPGILTPTGSHVAAMVVEVRRNNAVIVMDMGGGYGGAAKQRLNDNDIEVHAFNGANESQERSEDRQLSFANKRSEAIWRFREALSPDQDGGSPIALPPDPQVLADLTAPRWKLTPRGILVEPKDDLKKAKRLGRSPDKGDAIIMAWSEGERAIVSAMRRAQRLAVAPVPLRTRSDLPSERGTGWMTK